MTLAGLLAIALAACAGNPNEASGVTGNFDEAAAKTTKALDHVYDELEGLSGEERTKKLIELAKKEDGTLLWYTAAADDDNQALRKKFKQATGITVDVYRASSATALSKSIQEAKAGRLRGDVLNFSGLDPTIAAHEHLYAPLKTPIADQMVPGAVHDDWIADQLYPFIVAWNTKKVKSPPKTFRDALTQFPDGQLAFEATDENWLFGVVNALKDKGMSEKAAIKLVADAARKGVPISGHTLSSELLAAGKYSALMTSYHYRTQRQVEDGAPIGYQPQPMPIITTVSGTGIAATTDMPATALLFVEFQLTGEQEYWVKAGRTPTNKNYHGGVFKQFDQDDLMLIDSDKLYSELSKWHDLYTQMMQSSGRPVQGD